MLDTSITSPLSFRERLTWWYFCQVEASQIAKVKRLKQKYRNQGKLSSYRKNRIETAQPEGRGFRIYSKALEKVDRRYSETIKKLLSLGYIEVMDNGSYLQGVKCKAYAMLKRVSEAPTAIGRRQIGMIQKAKALLSGEIKPVAKPALKDMGLSETTKPLPCGRVNTALTFMEKGERQSVMDEHYYKEFDASACNLKGLAFLSKDPEEKERLIKIASAEDPYMELLREIVTKGSDYDLERLDESGKEFCKKNPPKPGVEPARHYIKLVFNKSLMDGYEPAFKRVFDKIFPRTAATINAWIKHHDGSMIYKLMTRAESAVMNWCQKVIKTKCGPLVDRIHDAIVVKECYCDTIDVDDVLKEGFERLWSGELKVA
jgi:hypothetical protein